MRERDIKQKQQRGKLQHYNYINADLSQFLFATNFEMQPSTILMISIVSGTLGCKACT